MKTAKLRLCRIGVPATMPSPQRRLHPDKAKWTSHKTRREPMVTLQVAFAAMALSGVGQTVLLDFYSDSCGPCREMNPTVQALINAGYPVQRVNVDQEPRGWPPSTASIASRASSWWLTGGKWTARWARRRWAVCRRCARRALSAARSVAAAADACHEQCAAGPTDCADAAAGVVFRAASIVAAIVRSVGTGRRRSANSSALEGPDRRLRCRVVGGQRAAAG